MRILKKRGLQRRQGEEGQPRPTLPEMLWGLIKVRIRLVAWRGGDSGLMIQF